jgi:hypothetical protein
MTLRWIVLVLSWPVVPWAPGQSAAAQSNGYPSHLQVEPIVVAARVSSVIDPGGWTPFYGLRLAGSLSADPPILLVAQYTPRRRVDGLVDFGGVSVGLRRVVPVVSTRGVFAGLTAGLARFSTDDPSLPTTGFDVGLDVEYWLGPSVLLRGGPGVFGTFEEMAVSVDAGLAWVPSRW